MSIHQTDSAALLEQLSNLPLAQKRGKLRIYLGYAAGVGKTYSMLGDALEVMESGVDVIVGYVEPHMRPETTAMLEGLEVLPSLELLYKGVSLREFDLDGALQRHPSLILVDELAHTNASGCRHKKRYQDVEELLQAGIDVFTTLNVQHIESLNDIVESITGVHVNERIPDSVFDTADQIELVDIEADDLIDRLHRGKIYSEQQAQRALSNFFTKDKLLALREIALRCTADKVNRVAGQEHHETVEATGAQANEHILACVSASPTSAKVIRTAARMADSYHGSFTALFVETPEIQDMDERAKARIRENMRLAEQLGAQIVTVHGEDVPEQIAEYAKASRVSQIVLGRPLHGKLWFQRSHFVDRLSALAPSIDVYIIPDSRAVVAKKRFKPFRNLSFSLSDTLKSIVLLVLCTLIGFLFDYLGFSVANIITVYILGVQINAVVTNGRAYSVISSVFGVLLFNYFFTDPRFSLQAYDPGYFMTFIIMLAAALITSTLTKRIKEQVKLSAQKAHRTEVLLETNRKLQQAENRDAIIREAALQLVKLLERPVIIYLAGGDGGLAEPLLFPAKDKELDLSVYIGSEERSVAEWVYKNNKRAGATTNTLAAAKCLCLAVRSGGAVLAVVSIVMAENPRLEIFEKSMLIAILGEFALALEKEDLYESQKEIYLQMQQEQLRSNLLRAISHDLRTPLTSICGNAGVLIGNGEVLTEDKRQELYVDIRDDATWLINLVENLLSITRIVNGNLNLNMQAELLWEVITAALQHVNRKREEYRISVKVEDELLMAKMDSRLIIQVIINIVDNAIKYTPAGSEIQISARRDQGKVLVEISDDGPGISDSVKSKVFDLFYTGSNDPNDSRRGLGLGLSLCKSIIDAHGGTIFIRDNSPHGAIFGFTLQAEEVSQYV